MNLLLHINTAVQHAYVALSQDDKLIGFSESFEQKDHSSFLQPAIDQLVREAGYNMKDLKAVTVVNGPGSYTGLRVGLAAAKGLCFALKIPLVCISTLEWLAWPFRDTTVDVIVPMIDARRMEVFTAGYNTAMEQVMEPQALILDDQSFSGLLASRVLFTGDGAAKLPALIKDNPNCTIEDTRSNFNDQAAITSIRFREQAFADLWYTDPFYIKPFHSPLGK